jgi:hypothetical protein
MKLQDQVCTLEQAQKFEELGIKNHWHPGALKWTRHKKGSSGITFNTPEWQVVPATYLDGFGHHGSPWALNCAELGIMMPEGFISEYYDHYGCWHWKAVGWDEEHGEFRIDHQDDGEEYETEAEARAAAVLYAIEHKLITVLELNERLKA